MRAKLKERFENVGITYCEFGFAGCWRNNGLSFAHADKRRFLSKEQLAQVALACPVCHDKLDRGMNRHDMKALVLATIARRPIQP